MIDFLQYYHYHKPCFISPSFLIFVHLIKYICQLQSILQINHFVNKNNQSSQGNSFIPYQYHRQYSCDLFCSSIILYIVQSCQLRSSLSSFIFTISTAKLLFSPLSFFTQFSSLRTSSPLVVESLKILTFSLLNLSTSYFDSLAYYSAAFALLDSKMISSRILTIQSALLLFATSSNWSFFLIYWLSFCSSPSISFFYSMIWFMQGIDESSQVHRYLSAFYSCLFLVDRVVDQVLRDLIRDVDFSSQSLSNILLLFSQIKSFVKSSASCLCLLIDYIQYDTFAFSSQCSFLNLYSSSFSLELTCRFNTQSLSSSSCDQHVVRVDLNSQILLLLTVSYYLRRRLFCFSYQVIFLWCYFQRVMVFRALERVQVWDYDWVSLCYWAVSRLFILVQICLIYCLKVLFYLLNILFLSFIRLSSLLNLIYSYSFSSCTLPHSPSSSAIFLLNPSFSLDNSSKVALYSPINFSFLACSFTCFWFSFVIYNYKVYFYNSRFLYYYYRL